MVKTLSQFFILFLVTQSLQAELYTLRVGSGHPAGATVYSTAMRDFLVPELKRRVEERTEHELRIIEGYAGSIASVAETLEAVQIGILDIGGFCTCFEPAKMFLHNFQYFVPFGPQDAQLSIRIGRQVYDQHPWLDTVMVENYNQTIIALGGFDNYHLGTVEPWESIDDLQGVKIAGAGPNLPWLEFAGVVPVQSALPDGYMAMSTGVYSGWLMYPSSYFAYKFHEPAPNYTLIGFGAMGGAAVITMNHNSFQTLPTEIQDIITEVGKEYEIWASELLDERQSQGLRDLQNSGAFVRTLSEEARRGWAESLVDFPNSMAQEANSRGLPGSEILNTYIALINESGYQFPIRYTIE
ncbi:MAG: C4-dicarboxylate TRAP transporter substrate-binding protein [Gammaproteobacteria bacterium]|jgi:C4-dicarboxylate-binding protein DctP